MWCGWHRHHRQYAPRASSFACCAIGKFYCIEKGRRAWALLLFVGMPTALIGRGMADWVEVGLAWFFLLSGAALCLQWQGRFDAAMMPRYLWCLARCAAADGARRSG